MKKYNRIFKIIKQVFDIKEVGYNRIDDFNIVFYNGPVKMGKMPLCKFNVIKKVFDKEKIIKYEEIIEKLKNCNLKCYYCDENVYLLYKLVREMKQWSLDRINNDIGHNCENVFISCLECNLKKRTKNSDSFLFTKQLKINKLD